MYVLTYQKKNLKMQLLRVGIVCVEWHRSLIIVFSSFLLARKYVCTYAHLHTTHITNVGETATQMWE